MTPLEQAARAAQNAPSIFNCQPWSWRITGTSMELFADFERRIDNVDSDGRLLLLGCGTALHHARTYLAAAGWAVTVERLPDPARPELLARLHLGKPVPPDPEAVRMAGAIARRRAQRRGIGNRPVTEFELTKLRRFAESEGAGLHTVRTDEQGAVSVVLFGRGARPGDLLRAGESLSALLLLAAADGLSATSLSDAAEVAWPRQLISDSGVPYLIVRLGYPAGREPAPATPHHDLRDLITLTK
ncbi:nitroreductase [Actinoplanes sp. NPDC049596]|uniref:nitroreductase n=1 Tax=unclassified Actinoplanes TaxID=2626549 RepID=UPI003446E544